MELARGRWSIGALMRLIVLLALQLALFQGVWSILLVPPMTIGLLTVNVGVVFGLVHPRSWETRIIGMLLGGFVGLFASVLFFALEMRLGEPGVLGSLAIRRLEDLAPTRVDPGGELASALRFIGRHSLRIESVLLDLLGIALIWAGGRLDERLRRRWTKRRAARHLTSTPEDSPVVAP